MMERPDWIAGSEERFMEFISKLNSKDNIALVSHEKDLDGIISAKVISEFVKPRIVRLLDYKDLNESLVNDLANMSVNKVIFSDLNLKKKSDIEKIEEFADVLIIDHHNFAEDFNSERTIFMNSNGFCAAYLCYYLFSKVIDLEGIDWMVAYASISDWCFFKNQSWMDSVFSKYGEKFIGTADGIKKGKFWDGQYKLYLALVYYEEDIMDFYNNFPKTSIDFGELTNSIKEVEDELNRLCAEFEKNKEEINGRYFFEVISSFRLKSILSNIKSHENSSKTYIFVQKEKGIVNVTLRRQDKKEDVSILAKKLVEGLKNGDGGGHTAASGATFSEEDYDKFLKNLKLF